MIKRFLFITCCTVEHILYIFKKKSVGNKIIMNTSLIISTIVIFLCMELTVQMETRASSKVKAEPSSVHEEKKTCNEWILSNRFTNELNKYEINLKRAKILRRTMKLDDPVHCTLNIWTRGYALTILSRIGTNLPKLFPQGFCSLLNQKENYKWELITPISPLTSCINWIFLSGYSAIDDTINEGLASKHQKEKYAPFAPKCVTEFINILTSNHERYLENPIHFCQFFTQITDYKTPVHYNTCKT